MPKNLIYNVSYYKKNTSNSKLYKSNRYNIKGIYCSKAAYEFNSNMYGSDSLSLILIILVLRFNTTNQLRHLESLKYIFILFIKLMVVGVFVLI